MCPSISLSLLHLSRRLRWWKWNRYPHLWDKQLFEWMYRVRPLLMTVCRVSEWVFKNGSINEEWCLITADRVNWSVSEPPQFSRFIIERRPKCVNPPFWSLLHKDLPTPPPPLLLSHRVRCPINELLIKVTMTIRLFEDDWVFSLSRANDSDVAHNEWVSRGDQWERGRRKHPPHNSHHSMGCF